MTFTTVDFVEDGGCPGCPYMAALKYLLEHGTGTGRLRLTTDELVEMQEKRLLLICLRLKDKDTENDN